MAEENSYKWVGPVGADAITLKVSIAKWLGPRLVFLAENTTSAAPGQYESERLFQEATKAYLADMHRHGEALVAYAETEVDEKAAHLAMHWVAENFVSLCD